jgi:uncharacterized protein
MTTNGTMLTPRNIETLVKHDVLLAISIDGPDDQHDRLRVDSRDRGTFARIVRNLEHIKEKYPDYWRTKVTSVSVYDWGTDLEKVEQFFAENTGNIPRSVFVNQVGSRNTNWYERYTSGDAQRTKLTLARLGERYKHAKIEGKRTSYYLDCLIGIGISMVMLRRRALDARLVYLPFTGTCMPGDKLAVHVDGKIDMCERVNGRYPLGHLESGGIDYQLVREILERYQQQVMAFCSRCPATKHCGVCFSLAETEDGFAKDKDRCGAIAEDSKRRMSDYISILEANPGADFEFETDTSALEQKMLLQY